MRGQKMFNDIIKGSNLSKEPRKGRNDKLITMRNDCLLARYFYYGFYKNICYEEILRALVSEFFLSPNTITNIIQNHEAQLLAIRKRAAVSYYFQSKWPHLKW